MNDRKRQDAIGIMQETGTDAPNLPGLPVRLQFVDHQHGIGRIGAAAVTIVGCHQKTPASQRTNAGKPLQRLTRKDHPSVRIPNGSSLLQATRQGITCRKGVPNQIRQGIPARRVQHRRRIGRRRDETGGRQHGMT